MVTCCFITLPPSQPSPAGDAVALMVSTCIPHGRAGRTSVQFTNCQHTEKKKRKVSIGKCCASIFIFIFTSLLLLILTVRGKAGGDPASEVSVILSRGIEVAGISFWNVVAPSQGTAPVRIVGEICLAIVPPVVPLSTGIVVSVQTAAAATALVSTWRIRVHSKCEMRCTRVFSGVSGSG